MNKRKPLTQEHKDKLSKLMTGVPKSPEAIAKRTATVTSQEWKDANPRRDWTEAERAKMSKRLTGTKQTPEHVAKTKAARATPESRAKASLSGKNKPTRMSTKAPLQTDEKRAFYGRAPAKTSFTSVARKYLEQTSLDQLCLDTKAGKYTWEEFTKIINYWRHLWTFKNVMSKKMLYTHNAAERNVIRQASFDVSVPVTERHNMQAWRDANKQKEV